MAAISQGDVTTNRKIASAMGGALKKRFDRVERVGEAVNMWFGAANRAKKKKKWRGRWGLGFRWLLLDGRTQQPTEKWPYR